MASITVDELQVLITANAKDLDKKLDQVKDKLNGTSKQSKKTGGVMSDSFAKIGKAAKVGLTAGVVGSIAAIGASIPSAVRRIDTLNNSTRTFENMGIKTKDAEKAMEDLNESITGLPTPLDSAVRGMTALTATYGDVNKGQEVFSALNNAILGFGGSAAEVDGAIVQLSQLPMDGPLDAQTWNSLRNNGLTPVIKAMADDMGMGVAEMKEAFGSGELSVQDFTDKLIDMNHNGGGGMKSLEQIAKDSTKGIGTSFANLQTSITRSVANVIKELGPENFSGAINGMAGLVDDIGEKIVATIPSIKKKVHEAMAKVFEFGDLIKDGNLVEAGKQLGTAIGNGVAESIKLLRIGMDTIKGWFDSINWGELGVIVGTGALAFIGGLVVGLFSTESLMQFVGFIADNWVEVLLTVAAIAFAPSKLLGPIGKLFTNVINKIPFGPAFTTAFGKVVTALRGFVEPIRTAFHGAVVAPITRGTSGLVKGIKSIITAVKDIMLNPFRLAVQYIADYIKMIPPVAKAAVDLIKGWFAPMTAWFKNLFSAVFNTVKSWFGMFSQPASSAWSGIKGVFSGVGGWFKGIFQGAWNSIKSIFGGMSSWFGNINLSGAGRKIIESFVGGIRSMIGRAKDAASSVVKAVRDFFPFSPAKEGPFSGKGYTTHSGRALMEDFAKGIGDNATKARKAAMQAVSETRGVMSADLAGLSSGRFDSSVNVQHGFSDFTDSGNTQPLIINVGGERLIDTVIEGINGRSFLGGSSVINV